MSKYLSVYQLLVCGNYYPTFSYESSNNFILVLFCPETGSNIVTVVFLIKHSNLFVITHFSVLFQDESLRLTNSHFVQLFPLCAGTHTLSIFNIYPLHNSRIVRYNSGIGGQSKNSHFAQDNSGIVPILTLRRTYIHTYKHNEFTLLKSLDSTELLRRFLKWSQSLLNTFRFQNIYIAGTTCDFQEWNW